MRRRTPAERLRHGGANVHRHRRRREVGLVLEAEFDDELGYPILVVISSEFADRQTDTEIAPFGVVYTLS